MQTLNWLDYSIIIVIGLSSLISLIRGFIREALPLVSWIVAFWVALTFSNTFEVYLQPYIAENMIRYVVTFISLFIATLLAGAIINFIITHLVEKTGLSGTDRLLGIFFGCARGILVVSILLLAARMTALPQNPLWTASQLIPLFAPVERSLANYVPQNIQDQVPAGGSLIMQVQSRMRIQQAELTNAPQHDPLANVTSSRKPTVDTQMMNTQIDIQTNQPKGTS